jgi:RNase H-fold protein (predicted Holliday junction resolvase)
VFNDRGKLIGIIMALDVGTTQYGVDVLENLLIVVPVHHIDWVNALHR